MSDKLQGVNQLFINQTLNRRKLYANRYQYRTAQ